MKNKYLNLLLFSLVLSGCSEATSTFLSSENSDSSNIVINNTQLDIINIGLNLINDEPYFVLNGKYNETININKPFLTINNTQDNINDNINKIIEYDDELHTFSAKISLVELSKIGSWYNIEIVFNSFINEKYSINTNLINNDIFSQSLDYKISEDIYRRYYFEKWDDTLKIVFVEKDYLNIYFYNMEYVIEEIDGKNQLFLHLHGLDEHENQQFYLSYGNEKNYGIITFENNKLDACIRVDNILNNGNKYLIIYSYELTNGTMVYEEINSKNLSDYKDLRGICFETNLYVFYAIKTGNFIYYRASNCKDNFSMDYIGINFDQKVYLEFSGTIKIFSDKDYLLHIRTSDNPNDDLIYDISRFDIDASGYLKTKIDISDIPELINAGADSKVGLLQMYHKQLFIGGFWQEWTHYQDQQNPVIYNGYSYQILKNNDDSLKIIKEKCK